MKDAEFLVESSGCSKFKRERMHGRWCRKHKHMMLSLTVYQIAQYFLLALIVSIFFYEFFFRPGA